MNRRIHRLARFCLGLALALTGAAALADIEFSSAGVLATDDGTTLYSGDVTIHAPPAEAACPGY